MTLCAVACCPAEATRGPFCPAHDPAPMTVVCAWCGLVLKEGGPTITHGICKPCESQWEITYAALPFGVGGEQ